ncbi:SDR family oxidoreductase [Nocardioides sp. cx-169]|uniref:SDR family NAD(P)-dependent oxidoreductase n=1 Tax=Nocardioides sp. cx-169 TaxID=2899080 RepID=UPI001E3AB7F4|nr:SDR family oxidoreductase [Nocardioides sp. cx-169]MCD4535183.1 SDR family oxidoreductase [Nocardioides sp. cx-169]
MSGPEAGRQAIVTGGGSGIGAALCRALVAAGDHVVVADLDRAAAARTAGSVRGPGSARPLGLDVTDAAAVQAAVDEVVAVAGRLDLMFNNAGISLGGETEELTLAQWDAIIDVNIRGVVHGVAAAYPVMVRQGAGHIVNTASMGGLMAAGLLTSYVMTKHAVVGLSLALRSEAAAKGVGVTAVCPSAVDTPILDKGAVGRFHGRDYFLKGQGVRRPYDPDVLAQEVLRAVRDDRGLLVTPRTARVTWLIGRLAPVTTQRMSVRFVAKQRALQAARAAALSSPAREL